MDIVPFILERLEAARRAGRERILLGVCGRAGSGKTTLARRIVRALKRAGTDALRYSGDWRFVHDSPSRKRLLEESAKDGLSAYLASLDQRRWWDFEAVRRDLRALTDGNGVTLAQAYDRETGLKVKPVRLPALRRGVVLYENAILGGSDLLRSLDAILLLRTPDAVCLRRILKKDAGRRTGPEIAARYLVTTRSENEFFGMLRRYSGKLVTCDDRGMFAGTPGRPPLAFLPVPEKLLQVPARKRKILEREGLPLS